MVENGIRTDTAIMTALRLMFLFGASLLITACLGSNDVADTTPADALSSTVAPVSTTPIPSPGETADSGLPEVFTARAAHTANTLEDGRVLVAGGCVVDGCGVGSNETFLISSDGQSWEPGPQMSVARSSHTTTVLPSGSTVIVGGFPGEGQQPTASVDVFDPRRNEIFHLGELETRRGGHAAAPAGDDAVLVVGGWVRSRTYAASAELINVGDGVVRQAADMPYAADALDAVRLPDGRVLVTGGQVEPSVGTRRAEIYDPVSDRWDSAGQMTVPRFKHLSVALPDGRVLIVGGTTNDQDRLTSTEIFDPGDGSFTPGPTMSEPRYKMTGGAVVLEDGRVVVGGGGRTVEVLDLVSGTSTVVADLTARGSFATVNRLGSGPLLVLGGYDDRINLRRQSVLLAVEGW
jgi:hypothetical protein